MTITENEENEVQEVDEVKGKDKCVIQLIVSSATHRQFKSACATGGATMTGRLRAHIKSDIEAISQHTA